MCTQMIYPYYHPTTCIFVDDNVSFLRGVDLAMNPDLAYHVIDNEHIALRLINQKSLKPNLPERFTRDVESMISQSNIHETIGTSLIEQEISNRERFHQVSVVVVDYSMPNISGIGFCNAIRNPAVGKVLLTGAADEAVAVAAFNRGSIDRFVTKNKSNTLDLVAEYIDELEGNYFARLIENMRKSLALRMPEYLQSSDFENAFFSFLRDIRCKEYYLVTKPDGFLLLDNNGKLYRMIVLSSAGMREQEAYLARVGAPREIIRRLHNRQCIAGLLEDEDAIAAINYPWRDDLYEAHPIGSGPDWYIALIPDPPIDIDFDPNRASYASYLEALDLIHEEWLSKK